MKARLISVVEIVFVWTYLIGATWVVVATR